MGPTGGNILFGMIDLDLIHEDGPVSTSGGFAYYKVRQCIWDKMIELGWDKEGPKWDETAASPWMTAT
jgi:hypothetical protein